jgi:hypothetical protein
VRLGQQSSLQGRPVCRCEVQSFHCSKWPRHICVR